MQKSFDDCQHIGAAVISECDCKTNYQPGFTIEDIHKVREQNYERTKDMAVAEKLHITIIPARKQKENFHVSLYRGM